MKPDYPAYIIEGTVPAAFKVPPGGKMVIADKSSLNFPPPSSSQFGVSETFLLISSVLLTVSTIYLVETIQYARGNVSLTRSSVIREVRVAIRRETTIVLQRRTLRRPNRQEQERIGDEVKDLVEEIMDRALEKLQADTPEKSKADQKSDQPCAAGTERDPCRQRRVVCPEPRC